MSHLVTCPGCKSQMAAEVRRCPQCGRRTEAGYGTGLTALVIVGLVAVILVAIRLLVL